MVAPVTQIGGSNLTTTTYVKNRLDRWKQAKPIDRPLPYKLQAGKEVKVIGDRAAIASLASSMYHPDTWGHYPGPIAAANLAAYERLRGMVSDRAMLGAALAEMGQATRMIYTRMTQILGMLRAIRKLDFLTAAAMAKISVVPKGASVSKSFASNWLEFAFGWRPLIQDCYAACDVLQSPIKSIRPRASATWGSRSYTTTSGSIPSGGYSVESWAWTFSAQTGCEVTVTNPNLYLLNNLGLANPGTVIWEVIPFSFVVDWFTTIGEFLHSGTDWLGLSVSNAYHTCRVDSVLYQRRYNIFLWPQNNEKWSSHIWLDRKLGLYSPVIMVRPGKIPGWGRAANATALVIQLLSR